MPECFYCETKTDQVSSAIFRDGLVESQIQVCSECHEDYCFTCTGCNNIYDIDCRNVIRTGKNGADRFFYCVSCRNENTFHCNTCNERHHNENRHKLRFNYLNKKEIIFPDDLNNKYTCNACYKNSFFKCGRCTSDTFIGNAYANQIFNRVCRKCHEAEVTIKRYKSDPLDYMPFQGDAIKGKSTLYMGVELEVTLKNPAAYSREGVALQFLPLFSKFAIFTQDASVPNGWEIKTVPATFDYHMTAWEPFFYLVDKNGEWLQQRGEKCGMHVHLSRSALSPSHIGRFVCFINDPGNRDFMKKIAERDSPEYAPYRDSIRAIHDWKQLSKVDAHHQAVNCLKPATIEVRIFASMLKRENFYKNLEFLKALVEFTKPSNCYDYRSYSRFEEYVARHERDYPNLYAFLNPPKAIKPIKRKTAQRLPDFLEAIREEEVEALSQWIGINPIVVNA